MDKFFKDKSEALFELLNNLDKSNQQNIAYYVEIGAILHQIQTEKLYLHYASHIKTWIDFLKEINYTFTDAKHHIEMYLFISDKEETITSIPLQRLKQLAQAKIHPEESEELCQKALSLPVKDWNDELLKLKGYQSYLNCEHQDTEEFQRCTCCGKWIKS